MCVRRGVVSCVREGSPAVVVGHLAWGSFRLPDARNSGVCLLCGGQERVLEDFVIAIADSRGVFFINR